MAIETFSVELEAQLTDFLNSLKEAQKNLDGLEKFANATAKDIDKSFADVQINLKPEGIEETSSAIDKITESASTAGSVFQRINENFGTIRSTIVTLGKTFEVFGERLNLPALKSFGAAIFLVGKQLDNSSDAFEALKKAFTTGDIDGIAKSFGRFAFIIKNLGQLIENLGRRLTRLARLGAIFAATFGLFSKRARLVGRLVPILSQVGAALTSVGKRAKKTAGFIGEVGDGLPGDNVVKSTSALALLGRALIKLLKVGAIILAFKGLKAIFFDIAGGAKRTSVALTTLTRAAGLGVSSVAALGASAVGTTTPLGRLLTGIDKAAFATARLSGAAGTLAKGAGVRKFAGVASSAMQRAEDATIRVARAIPGVGLAFRGASAGVRLFNNNLGPAIKQARALGNNIIGLSTGTLGFVPGLNRVVKGTKKLAIGATIAATSLSGTSGAMGLLASASGKLLAGLAGLNVALIVLGVALDAIGKKLINTLRGFAVRADKANLAFTRLENTLKATEAATGLALGGIEDFRVQAQELSAATGQNIVDIIKLQTVFVGLNQTLKLPINTLNDIIKSTALAGTSINDLGGSVIAVKDAFIGILRPLLLRFGATIKQEQVDKLAAQAAEGHADSLEGLGDEAVKAANNLAVAELVLKALGPSASVAEQASLSLSIETGKLAAAQDLMARTIGERSVPSMALLAKTSRLVVSFFQPLVESTAFLIAPLGTLAGVVLRVGGNLLKFGTIFGILANSFAIINRLLQFNIGGFGKLSSILSNFTEDITGAKIEITSLRGVLRGLGAFIVKGFRTAGTGVVNFAKKITEGGASATAFRLTIGPLTKVVKNFFTVMKTGVKTLARVISTNLKLIATSTVWLLVIALVVAAVVKLFQKYDLLNKITAFVSRLFRRLFGDGTGLAKVFEKLGQVIQLVALGGFALLEGILLIVSKAVGILARTFATLLKVMNFITFGLTGLGPILEEIATEIADTADAASNQLAKGLAESTLEIVDLGKELVTGEKRMKVIKKTTKLTTEEFEKLSAKMERLGVFADIGIKGIESSIQSVVDSTEKTLDQLENTFKTKSAKLAATAGEGAAGAIADLERNLIRDVTAIQEAGLDKIKEFTDARVELQLASLGPIKAGDKQAAAERIALELSFTQDALQIQKDFLTKTQENTQTRIQNLKDRQAERIQIIKDADNAIRDSRKRLQDKLFEIELRGLKGPQRTAAINERLNRERARLQEALNKGDVKGAEASRSRILDANRSLATKSQELTNAQAQAQKLSVNSSTAENLKALDKLRNSFNILPNAAVDAFLKVKAAIGTSISPEDFKARVEALTESLKLVAQQEKDLVEINAFKEDAKNVELINEKIKEQQRVRKAADEEALTSAKNFFDTVTTRLEKVTEDLKDPRKLLLEADLTKFDAAIRDLQNNPPVITAILAINKADLKGLNSIHPLRDVADELRKQLSPGEIPAKIGIEGGMRAISQMARGLGSIVPTMQRTFDEIAAPARQQFAASAAGSPVAQIDPFRSRTKAGPTAAKVVRVDLNFGGEQMEPINVSSDKDADNLVKAIKRTNRTRGNFRTPFTKNG